jgi:hypothetical protein
MAVEGEVTGFGQQCGRRAGEERGMGVGETRKKLSAKNLIDRVLQFR